MAYTKQTWQTGETITADKLNHIEDGIAGGTLVIGGFSNDDDDNLVGTSDKTWQEIDNALATGARCVVVVPSGGGHYQKNISIAGAGDGDYIVADDNGNFEATTTSADGYPVAGGGLR